MSIANGLIDTVTASCSVVNDDEVALVGLVSAMFGQLLPSMFSYLPQLAKSQLIASLVRDDSDDEIDHDIDSPVSERRHASWQSTDSIFKRPSPKSNISNGPPSQETKKT